MENNQITVQNQSAWQFKKGQSGNIKGKPKGALSHKTIVKKALKRIATAKRMKIDDVDIVVSYLNKALNGNTPILLDYMNRTFGVPKPIEQEKVIQPIIIIPSSLSNKYIESTTLDNDNNM